MKLNIPIEGIQAEIRGRNVVIQSNSPLRALTSSVLSRSYAKFMAIVNQQIPIDYDHAEPEKVFLRAINSLGLPKQTLGLMTAVDVNNVSVISKKHEKLTVCAVVTAGVTNPAAAGDNAPEEPQSNTINTILLIDGNLTQHCMVNAVMTATEAKSAALRGLDIRSRLSTELATGTTSDTIAVACTGRGRPIMFAGTATRLGELIGKTVKEAVKKAIHKQENLAPNRPLTKRLEERGISIANMTNLFSQVRPTIRENAETWRQFTEELLRVLSDQNIASLVIAGLRLDEDAKMGLIPEIQANAYEKKPALCEILETAVADYLSKKNVTSERVKLDDLSSAVADRIGLFTRSILFAVMNAVYSNSIADHSEKCE